MSQVRLTKRRRIWNFVSKHKTKIIALSLAFVHPTAASAATWTTDYRLPAHIDVDITSKAQAKELVTIMRNAPKPQPAGTFGDFLNDAYRPNPFDFFVKDYTIFTFKMCAFICAWGSGNAPAFNVSTYIMSWLRVYFWV